MPVDKVAITANEEDNLPKSDSEESNNRDLNNTITNFSNLGGLGVNIYLETNKKRNRSEDSTSNESPNPLKKPRLIFGMIPSMADAVKMVNEGHVIDIMSVDGKPPITKDQSEDIKKSITNALFAMEDISKIKFEDPYYDGNKLRVICNNDVSKDWLEEAITKLENLWEGAEIKIVQMGPPPKLINSTIILPAKTYEPSTLFSIISAQNQIDTKFWRYKSRTKIENGRQTWSIGVDESSIPSLKELGYRPYAGFGRIKISVGNQNAK